MRQRIYVMGFHDARKTGAYAMLAELRAVLLSDDADLQLPLSNRDDDVVAVFICVDKNARFPSKHIRVLESPQLAREKGFTVPGWVPHFTGNRPSTCVIIHPRACDTENLRTALTDFHHRNIQSGSWIGPKSPRQHGVRLARHVERRRERREYALP